MKAIGPSRNASSYPEQVETKPQLYSLRLQDKFYKVGQRQFVSSLYAVVGKPGDNTKT